LPAVMAMVVSGRLDELLGTLGRDQDVAKGAVDAIGNLFHESSSADPLRERTAV